MKSREELVEVPIGKVKKEDIKRGRGGEVVVEIPIKKVKSASMLKRKEGYEDQDFIELVASIKAMGIIEPLVVVKAGDHYQVVAGMRRLMAGTVANLLTVPCLVRKMTKEEKVKVRWMENENRKNIDALERASFIRELMEEMGWNQSEVSKKLQKSEGFISQHLKVLYGYKVVRELLGKGEISFSVARELNRAKNEEIAERLSEFARGNNAGDKQVRLWVANENSKKEVIREEVEGSEEEAEMVTGNIMELCEICGEGKNINEIRWVKMCRSCRSIVQKG